MTVAALAGRRIMLVEDELLIAMLLEASLQDHGCHVVGPFARVDEAEAAARSEAIDAALMDVNLNGQRVFPVAHALSARGVPFLLLSGYGAKALPADRPHWPILSKPFEIDRAMTMLGKLLSADREDDLAR